MAKNNGIAVSKLEGGLGNQMFQYAFAINLAQRNNCKLVLDLSFYDINKRQTDCTPRNFELNIFNISSLEASESDIKPFMLLSFLNKIKKRACMNYPKVYQETNYNFQKEALLIKPPVYLRGYFQSYKYFIGNEDLIKRVFSFPIDILDNTNSKLLSEISSMNTISVHVRRGDYVSDIKTKKSHGNCSLSYYFEAIALLTSDNKDYKLVFFSDDINWVKNNFEKMPYSKLFIDHNTDENSWKDMLLMSSCTHNIIANSSFSWWGAWLNNNPNKCVVAPEWWTANNKYSSIDLLPKEWIRF